MTSNSSSDFAVLLGGDITPTDRLREQVSGRRIIAADAGIRHARVLEVNVELWVGDFDSASPTDHEDYPSVERQTWPAAKDKTDGEIALDFALEHKPGSVLVVGAFGGRAAHATNHLLMGFGHMCEFILSSGTEEAQSIGHQLKPDWPEGVTFSILAFDDLEGLTVKGARWPLNDVSVPSGSGWTLSNQVEGQLSISLKSGRAMLVGELPS